jgi:hypothetical protein
MNLNESQKQIGKENFSDVQLSRLAYVPPSDSVLGLSPPWLAPHNLHTLRCGVRARAAARRAGPERQQPAV